MLLSHHTELARLSLAHLVLCGALEKHSEWFLRCYPVFSHLFCHGFAIDNSFIKFGDGIMQALTVHSSSD